jgi:hypothetical protein
MMHYVSPKRWHIRTIPHGATVQKSNTDIIIAVTTSDLIIRQELTVEVMRRFDEVGH